MSGDKPVAREVLHNQQAAGRDSGPLNGVSLYIVWKHS